MAIRAKPVYMWMFYPEALYLYICIGLVATVSVFYAKWVGLFGENISWSLYGACVSLVLCTGGTMKCKFISSSVLFLFLIIFGVVRIIWPMPLIVTYSLLGLVSLSDTRLPNSFFYRLPRAFVAGVCGLKACEKIAPLVDNVDSFRFEETLYILPVSTFFLLFVVWSLDYTRLGAEKIIRAMLSSRKNSR